MAGIRPGDKRLTNALVVQSNVLYMFYVRNMFFSGKGCWPLSVPNLELMVPSVREDACCIHSSHDNRPRAVVSGRGRVSLAAWPDGSEISKDEHEPEGAYLFLGAHDCGLTAPPAWITPDVWPDQDW